MSNYVTIDRTIFQTIDADGAVVDSTYGIRVYDDHAAFYDNYVGSLDELKALSATELVDRAAALNEGSADMIEFARMNGASIIVDGVDVNVQDSEVKPA